MEPEEIQQRKFSRDEVGELIETATRLDQLRSEGGELTIDDLRQVAAELGVSETALEAALEQRATAEREVERIRRDEEAEAAERQALADVRRKRWNEWKAHVASYVAVMAGLTVIDLVDGGGLSWVVYPAAGWGIGLAVHTFQLLFGVADDED